ncbi:hypothetical protein [Pseudoalteromonas peptidolytica]|uniref:Uncharacterized protein n=1 Tax=Pseudoalteromonas peptidolytica F12-50-A1 TaxID=1315280 RepID=A0A8I0T5Q4_9GAMM|nr:hypothetical protein [Pseudoalteromonas peptidolytica]MBE0348285.1 hypothetical protein [Pseudoalteromonas peptidolytica F12-50-A1]NLR16570.1 hypothetical protein [Pseudoalteromonas peptidolytica]GEK08940.1 hypothetical protein PPE03_11890 [Pseudoalteromonas peptidolytica]
MLPDGTKLFIADSNDSANPLNIVGFEDIGDLGKDEVFVNTTVLSDDAEVFEVSKRKEGAERDLICRYEPDDEGQKALIAAGNAKEKRKLLVQVPGIANKWEFIAQLSKSKVQKPESGKGLMLVMKIAIESETGSIV